jgi:hypothetical protein
LGEFLAGTGQIVWHSTSLPERTTASESRIFGCGRMNNLSTTIPRPQAKTARSLRGV